MKPTKLFVDPLFIYNAFAMSGILLLPSIPFLFISLPFAVLFIAIGFSMFLLMVIVGRNAFDRVYIDENGIRTKRCSVRWEIVNTLHIRTISTGIGRMGGAFVLFSSEDIPESKFPHLLKKYNKDKCVLLRITDKSRAVLSKYTDTWAG